MDENIKGRGIPRKRWLNYVLDGIIQIGLNTWMKNAMNI